MLRTAPVAFTVAAIMTGLPAADSAPTYPWQQAHARILPQGDLAWAPEPFLFTTGPSVRYIDFAAGDDGNDGRSQGKPWKHHPWDANATGAAKAGAGVHTYVFRRGVAYRGTLKAAGAGEPGNPIRLTSDPAWGEGEAEILGSEAVGGWQAGGSAQMPEAGKVWKASLPFAPRLVCAVARDGTVTRLKLARLPNWEISDPRNIYKECWAWENPNWWLDGWKPYRTTVDGGKTKAMLGLDTRHLIADAETYRDALVWSEWGIVMGTPYAAKVDCFDPEKKTIAFQGPWHGDSGMPIATNHRYWLEDKPQFLDQAGEFWFEKQGDGGTLYVRLPGDADPSAMRVEAARHATLIDAGDLSHIEISGLAFRFGNIAWDLTARFFMGDIATAGVRMVGSGTGISIHHCRFEHMAKAVIVRAGGAGKEIGTVRLADNDLADLDHGAVDLTNGFAGSNPVGAPWPGTLRQAEVLRNRVRDAGMRNLRGNHPHAIQVLYPETAEIAGNMVTRAGGAGIIVEGGKNDGGRSDAPFARILVHHNRVELALLNVNDYGGIETNMGGPFYVYGNVVIDAVGRMNWNGASFGHAYYVDGGFKAFLFNNLAWGGINTPKSADANCSAFQEIISYQNTYFNNTACRFQKGTRRQAPQAGRDKWLGNIFEDISEMVFRHSDAEGKDPNAKDAGAQAEVFAYETNAQSRNVLAAVGGKIGVFEAKGGDYPDLVSYAAALQGSKALAADVGIAPAQAVLRDGSGRDFRLVPDAPAKGLGVKVFVPWSLHATVGEWHFTRNQADPTVVIDEHWYLKPQMTGRDAFWKFPTWPLRGHGIAADSFVAGPLEDWTAGALRLDGKAQYLSLADVTPPPAPPEPPARVVDEPWFTATLPAHPTVGTAFTLALTLKDAAAAGILRVDLNCLRGSSFGGWIGSPGRFEAKGAGPYRMQVTLPEDRSISRFLLTAYLSPDGSWDRATARASIAVERTEPVPAFFDPQVAGSPFIVEAYALIEPGSAGVLVEKLGDKAGHSLTVDPQGRLVFAVKADGTRVAAIAPMPVADGAWHHLLAECAADGNGRTLNLHIDGRLVVSATGPVTGSLASTADLHVGGTPGGRCLAVTLDFLRLSRGSLSDARTSIGELHSWQFDGPFLRDFRGVRPAGRRDAGAIQGE